ncbi:cell cycle checkpoint protein, partial [Tremellales sp. Uapishka_1]
MPDVRPLARLLRGVGLKHQAIMTISDAGFQVSVDDHHTLSAIAYIPCNIFKQFAYTSDHAEIGLEIDLDTLLQCLNIFGNAGTSGNAPVGDRKRRRWAGDAEEGAEVVEEEWRKRGKERVTGMRMSWKGHGDPLQILLSDEAKGPMTTCEMYPSEPEDEVVEHEFDEEKNVLYLIMNSQWLRDALLDLPPSCSRITLLASPADTDEMGNIARATASSEKRHQQRSDLGTFSIRAAGDFGQTELDYPNDKEVMDRFVCEERVSFSYHYSHFTALTRALHGSTKSCLQIQDNGLLDIQIMMPLETNVPLGEMSGILEFKMLALDDDEE